jgi:hypothetical protein
VIVRWLGEEAVFLEPEADFPGGGLADWLDHCCVQQALATYKLNSCNWC